MPPLTVPQRFRAGILRIAEISQEGFDQLLAALKRAPSCKDTRELIAWIKDETLEIADADKELIIRAIVPMFRVQRNSGVKPTDFAGDVWESIGPGASGVDRDNFILRTSTLIEESALDLASSRIGDVKNEVERSFCKVRIMTDLRPAFHSDSEAPTDMAVMHNVQIGYHDGMDKHKEFYMTLDGEDLRKLKKAILEAEKRAQTLETLLEKSGVRTHR